MQRQREVGIQLALGALPRTVKMMFVYRGLMLSGVGIAIGAAVAAGLTRLMSSHAFWQQRFGGDEAALGRKLSIDSQPAEVVGIMPRDFAFLDISPPPDVILTERLELAEPGWFRYQMLARLEPGVTPAEARADVERMLSIWLAPAPDAVREAFGQIIPSVRPLRDDLVGSVASTLWVLMGALGAVLLIACANIANLMLVRAEARREELAMRAALGAVPARIARELLVESAGLGMAGGVLGVLLAYIGVQLLVASGPSNLPRLRDVSVYPPVLAFTAAVSLASTFVFGSLTALKHARHIDSPVLSAARGASCGSLVSQQGNPRTGKFHHFHVRAAPPWLPYAVYYLTPLVPVRSGPEITGALPVYPTKRPAEGFQALKAGIESDIGHA